MLIEHSINNLLVTGNNLLCGCDIDWIMYEPTYLATISDDTLCSNDLNIHGLDVEIFHHLCPLPEIAAMKLSYSQLVERYHQFKA